jgi:uncharacterized protein YabN with tetrapyrrole methylase and pyrophosphatase domain
LAVVGTGIRAGRHLTEEAGRAIREADRVLHLLAEPVARAWIRTLNPSAQSLHGLYAPGKPRERTYREIVEAVLAPVRAGLRVAFALYGHPGVCVAPSHEAIRRARGEGFEAVMLPAVSAEDCLVADLGLDPLERGCQSYEATDFLLRPPVFDPAVPLILWQVGVIGERSATGRPGGAGLQFLADRLAERYGPDHEVVVYEASPYPIKEPTIESVPLHRLGQAAVTGMSTLYVPPNAPRTPDPRGFERLRIPRDASS